MKRILHGILLLGIVLSASAIGFSCSETDDPAETETKTPEDDDRSPDNNGTGDDPIPAYDSEELYCLNGGKRIYGLMFRPRTSDTRMPAVILSHSYSLTHTAMESYARAIAEQGCAAYCFDFCGGSGSSLSDGDTSQMTVFTEVGDLEAVLTTIRALEYVDPDRIFLLGSSQGGLVSALAAEEHAGEASGMILFYPAFNIADMVNRFAGSLGSFGSTGSMGMSEAYVESLKDYDVFEHIGTFPKPILILHGSQDFIVPVSYSERAAALYPQAELQIIEGATHGFNEANLGGFGSYFGSSDYDETVLAYVSGYLSTYAFGKRGM